MVTRSKRKKQLSFLVTTSISFILFDSHKRKRKRDQRPEKKNGVLRSISIDPFIRPSSSLAPNIKEPKGFCFFFLVSLPPHSSNNNDKNNNNDDNYTDHNDRLLSSPFFFATFGYKIRTNQSGSDEIRSMI